MMKTEHQDLAHAIATAHYVDVAAVPAFDDVEWTEKLGFGERQIVRERREVREAYDVTIKLSSVSRAAAEELVEIAKRLA